MFMLTNFYHNIRVAVSSDVQMNLIYSYQDTAVL